MLMFCSPSFYSTFVPSGVPYRTVRYEYDTWNNRRRRFDTDARRVYEIFSSMNLYSTKYVLCRKITRKYSYSMRKSFELFAAFGSRQSAIHSGMLCIIDTAAATNVHMYIVRTWSWIMMTDEWWLRLELLQVQHWQQHAKCSRRWYVKMMSTRTPTYLHVI